MTTTATFTVTTPARKNPFTVTVELQTNGDGRPWIEGGYMDAANIVAKKLYGKTAHGRRVTGTAGKSGMFQPGRSGGHRYDHNSCGAPFHLTLND